MVTNERNDGETGKSPTSSTGSQSPALEDPAEKERREEQSRKNRRVWYSSIFLGILMVVSFWLNTHHLGSSSYATACESVLSHADPFNEVRVDFQYVEDGETYRVGNPNETTGYYTKYNMTAGRGTSEVTCFADVNGTFQYARVYDPEVGQVLGAACYDPSGNMSVCN